MGQTNNLWLLAQNPFSVHKTFPMSIKDCESEPIAGVDVCIPKLKSSSTPVFVPDTIQTSMENVTSEILPSADVWRNVSTPILKNNAALLSREFASDECSWSGRHKTNVTFEDSDDDDEETEEEEEKGKDGAEESQDLADSKCNKCNPLPKRCIELDDFMDEMAASEATAERRCTRVELCPFVCVCGTPCGGTARGHKINTFLLDEQERAEMAWSTLRQAALVQSLLSLLRTLLPRAVDGQLPLVGEWLRLADVATDYQSIQAIAEQLQLGDEASCGHSQSLTAFHIEWGCNIPDFISGKISSTMSVASPLKRFSLLPCNDSPGHVVEAKVVLARRDCGSTSSFGICVHVRGLSLHPHVHPHDVDVAVTVFRFGRGSPKHLAMTRDDDCDDHKVDECVWSTFVGAHELLEGGYLSSRDGLCLLASIAFPPACLE